MEYPYENFLLIKFPKILQFDDEKQYENPKHEFNEYLKNYETIFPLIFNEKPRAEVEEENNSNVKIKNDENELLIKLKTDFILNEENGCIKDLSYYKKYIDEYYSELEDNWKNFMKTGFKNKINRYKNNYSFNIISAEEFYSKKIRILLKRKMKKGI